MNMKFKLFNEAGAHLNGRVTYTAGGDIARGDVVKFNSDGEVVVCTGSTDAAIGVALDGSVDGEIVAIAVLGNYTGTVVVKAKGAITKGAKVGADGKVVTAGGPFVGIALDAATASGDLIEVAHVVQTGFCVGQGEELPSAASYIGELFCLVGAESGNGLYVATGTTTPGWKTVSHAS